MTPYKIAVFGLGTVGASFVKIIEEQGDYIASIIGRPVVIDGIYANNPNKDRGFNTQYNWAHNPIDYIKNHNPDAVLELIGGTEGIAPAIWHAALEHGCTLITANKALLASNGMHYVTLAERHNASLFYEAAVAGGIPIIRHLTQVLAGNKVHKIRGIMNGTCNFIISEMANNKSNFNTMLVTAQELGYAEIVPDFDIDGIDAGHKLAILSSLAFGITINFDAVSIRGIRDVTLDDIMYANDLGYTLKLIAYSTLYDDGTYSMNVEPVLLPNTCSLAHIGGVYNAVETCDNYTDDILLTGQGAGGNATASAVLSDLICAMRGIKHPALLRPSAMLHDGVIRSDDAIEKSYFMVLNVQDRPGVLAALSQTLSEHAISIEHLLQKERNQDNNAVILVTTHTCNKAKFHQAFTHITNSDYVMATPRYYSIEA